MRLEEAYRLLDLPPSASEEEVAAAYRDLTKVWHPDRFGSDPAMQRKAEEKLKQINEAFQLIRSGGRESPPPPSTPEQRRRSSVTWAVSCALLAMFLLLRRPTLGGLLVAGVLFIVAAVLFLRK